MDSYSKTVQFRFLCGRALNATTQILFPGKTVRDKSRKWDTQFMSSTLFNRYAYQCT